MSATTTWAVKHRPSDSTQLVGNEEAINAVRRWLATWKTGTPSKRAAFLFGPTGVGKTLSVSLLAKELDFDQVEMNASDHRTRDAVERIAGMAASESDLYMRKKVILLDELEGMSGTQDRGGLATIVSLVKRTRSPIILIATSAWDQKFTALRESCLLVEFKRIPVRSMVPKLRGICVQERVEVSEEALRVIAERARGDLRSAITDLQALAQGREKLAYDDVSWLDERDRQEPIFDVLRNIFNAETIQRARNALNSSEVDYEMVFEWVYENVPYQIPEKTELSEAMDALSRADIFLSRVRSKQQWHLLPYAIEEFTGSVAMSRTKKPQGWVPFKFPQRIRSLSHSRAERGIRTEIGRKIGRKCHVSISTAVNGYLPYLRIILRQHGTDAGKMIEWLDLSDDERDYLAG